MCGNEIQQASPISLSGDGVASGQSGDSQQSPIQENPSNVLVETESGPVDGEHHSPVSCLICGGKTLLAPIHKVWSEPGYRFWKCEDCGSETSDRRYTPADYDCDNRDDYFVECLGSWEACLNELNTNVWLFSKSRPLQGLSFLDVGYCDGAMMSRMSREGCFVFGFDVFAHKSEKIAKRIGVPLSCLVHGPSLDVVPGRYDLINCREVIEHIPNPHEVIGQMASLLQKGGLLQIQTPLPSGEDSRIPYQIQHLCLLSHPMLRAAGMAHGLKVFETMQWPLGQLVMFQKQ